jgi:glycopeptide antibiotics resistance protein
MIEFFPYPFGLGLLVLVWTLLRNRRLGWLHLAVLALFGLYLLALLDLVAFPIRLPARIPAYQSWNDLLFFLRTSVNLVPGNYGGLFSTVASGGVSPLYLWREVGGNLLLTVPFGLGLFLLPKARVYPWRVVLAAGLAPEALQLLVSLLFGPNMHSIDINDVLLNTLGVLLGLALQRAIASGWQKRRTEKNPG